MLHFDFVLYRRLLDQHADRVEALGNFPDPAVLFKSGKRRRNGFIERFGRDLDRVLDLANIAN